MQIQSARQKGDRYERLVKYHLETNYAGHFKKVWLWNDWPGRDGADTGIDIVAEGLGGNETWAVQCKSFEPATRIQKHHLDSFFTASGKHPFTARLIVATHDNWSEHAEAALHNQQIPCHRLRIGDVLSYYRDTLDVRKPSRDALRAPQTLRPHQQEAVDKSLHGLKQHDRGKLIMACGTGKTLTALHIAEKLAGTGGRVLVVVPSISLLSQSLREWALNKNANQRHFAVCSDTKVGRDNEDMQLVDLGYPATTDAESLYAQLSAKASDAMAVVFSTYHSLDVISHAQAMGARGLPPYDLIICDEAHRTTGIEREGMDVSSFSKIHNNAFIAAKKRLYMTATPRLYSEASKAKAKERQIEVISMDDESMYGPEFYRLDFSEAVEKGLLSDYKVLILGVSENFTAAAMQSMQSKDGEIALDDAAKIIGCWNALRMPEGPQSNKPPLKKAVAFTNSIKTSKKVSKYFHELIAKTSSTELQGPMLSCEVRHVDGTFHSLKRNRELDWLRSAGEATGDAAQCRILTNARCLSEGIDVPALDAVMFANPRKSQVDIVQAVGRVMRKAEGKDYGYIILPVVTPSGVAPEKALADNKRYEVVWEVLRALRSHDNRFNSMLNKLELNEQKPVNLLVGAVDEAGEANFSDQSGVQVNVAAEALQSEFDFKEWQNAIYARLVDKCGDRRYWETWAQDVAKVAGAIRARIDALLAKKGGLEESFGAFLANLHANINPTIRKEEAVDMLAQHMITQPVFDALFQDYSFSQHNPVSQAMQQVITFLESEGLKSEIEHLEQFYKSVRERVTGIDNLAGRQQVIIELYEKFFATAFPKVAERLGIVYTPIELVDFVLHSAEHVLQSEFASSLRDENVHVLDPFTGTGSFLVRLLQNEALLPVEQLQRKYTQELHANEIMLLAYYIAAVNIENAYHDRIESMTQVKNDENDRK